MNWKKWKIGFTVSLFFGLLTAGAGLAAGMKWQSFIAVLCAAILTNLGSYLMKHPIDEITFGDTQQLTKKDVTNNEKTTP